MSEWTPEELAVIRATEEVEVTPADADGAPTESVIMWAVTAGDEAFVRSVRGQRARWWRRASASGRGTFTAGSVTREVAFEPATAAEIRAVTDAFNEQYATQADEFLLPMVSGDSLEATLKVTPV